MDPEQFAAVAVFVAVFGLIAVGRVGRFELSAWKVALVGAAVTLLLGLATPEEVWYGLDGPGGDRGYFDYEVVILLVGMMAITASLDRTGFFRLLTERMSGAFGGRERFLVGTMLLTAVLTALMMNDAVVLIMVPIALGYCRSSGARPLPYVVGIIVAANIACAATVVGAPHVTLAASYSGLGFLEYSMYALPLVLLCLAVAVFMLRRHLDDGPSSDQIADDGGYGADVDRPRMYAVLAVLIVCVTLFALSDVTGVGVWVIAAAGGIASVLIAVTHAPGPTARAIAQRIDWTTPLFFVGLFVVVAGADANGIIDAIASVFGVADGDAPGTTGLVVCSSVLSAAISNVPSVLLVGNMLQGVAGVGALQWMALAFATSFSGSLTPIGGADNVIALNATARSGVRVGFVDYARAAMPVSIVTLALAIGYLALLGLLLRIV